MVLLLQVVEHIPALTDHLQQAAAGVVVLLVDLQMLGQVGDTAGEDGNLHLRGTGIALVGGVLEDDLLFLFLTDHVFSPH